MSYLLAALIGYAAYSLALVADQLGRDHEAELAAVDLLDGWEVIHL